MPALVLTLHSVGITMQVDVPAGVTLSSADLLEGRLLKPDHSDIIVPVVLSTRRDAVLFVTRQGDLGRVGTYQLCVAVKRPGSDLALPPASFSVISRSQSGPPVAGAYS